jgi:hypothetical protein
MENAMPEPLRESERRAFEALYFCRPEFGGIPLVLLAEKLQFVGSVLEDMVNHPSDDRPIQVFYQLLQFYAMMVSDRRKADVRIKEATSGTRIRYSTDAMMLEADSSPTSNHNENRDYVDAIYKRVAKVKNITCKCEQSQWDVKLEEVPKTHNFRLTFRCKRCNVTHKRVLAVTELQDIEAQLR